MLVRDQRVMLNDGVDEDDSVSMLGDGMSRGYGSVCGYEWGRWLVAMALRRLMKQVLGSVRQGIEQGKLGVQF